uniref:Methyltransferase type 11 n=1 Tax=Geobacter sp. (strain M21) TaxID=443144 RepID=C6E9I9_GEOSM
MAKIAVFDQQAANYDAWFDIHVEVFQAEVAAIRAAVPTSGRGVEIGVGTGRFAISLQIPVGVEPSSSMAELARQRGIDVLEGIAEALPLPDASFDYAVMVTVVCFLDDVATAFREAWRILKRGGVLVIGFIDRESELGKAYERKKKQSEFYRDATFYSVSELVKLMSEAGFRGFSYRQTLLAEEAVRLNVVGGHGSGGFVVIRAIKVE